MKLDDGVEFIPESIKSEKIKEEAEYSGIRIRLMARIGTARNTIQLDFGFGDIVTPKPFFMDYPTLMDKKGAKVLAYSKETIVAEKFEAIVKLTTFNSRMKDFFDLVFLAHEFEFKSSILQSSISNTFKHRKTDLNAALRILDSDLGEQVKFKNPWEAFKKRTKVTSTDSFTSIFSEIRQFLESIVKAELESKKVDFTWNRKKRKWE
jgi:hypothetical protein